MLNKNRLVAANHEGPTPEVRVRRTTSATAQVGLAIGFERDVLRTLGYAEHEAAVLAGNEPVAC